MWKIAQLRESYDIWKPAKDNTLRKTQQFHVMHRDIDQNIQWNYKHRHKIRASTKAWTKCFVSFIISSFFKKEEGQASTAKRSRNPDFASERDFLISLEIRSHEEYSNPQPRGVATTALQAFFYNSSIFPSSHLERLHLSCSNGKNGMEMFRIRFDRFDQKTS
jgi:hypothetical protein